VRKLLYTRKESYVYALTEEFTRVSYSRFWICNSGGMG
jgi:hypothetical protein